MSEKKMVDDKELKKWAGWVQLLLGILDGGGVVGQLIIFSGLGFCRRIFMAIAVIALTLALVTFPRLWLRAKNRHKSLLPNKPAPPLVKYLAENARFLLVSEFVLIIIFVTSCFLFVFPEPMNALPICATPTPRLTPTPIPIPSLTLTFSVIDGRV